jgi:hypothetical protein
VPGDLDERVVQGGLAVQTLGLLDGARGVVRQQRGHLERHPAVHAVGSGVDGREQAGGPTQVGQGQLEERPFARGPCRLLSAYVGVVGGAVPDRPVEDGGVGGEAGHRVLIDVARQDPLVHQGPGDVVQPEVWPASCSAWVGFMLPPSPAAEPGRIPIRLVAPASGCH